MSDMVYEIRFADGNIDISNVEGFLREALGDFYTECVNSWYGQTFSPRAFYLWPGGKNTLKIFVPKRMISNGIIDILSPLKGRFGGKYTIRCELC